MLCKAIDYRSRWHFILADEAARYIGVLSDRCLRSAPEAVLRR
jgi:hypothetical protein